VITDQPAEPEKTMTQLQAELAREILAYIGISPRDLDDLQWDNIRGAIAHYTVTIGELK
jgi:hypothetical protein